MTASPIITGSAAYREATRMLHEGEVMSEDYKRVPDVQAAIAEWKRQANGSNGRGVNIDPNEIQFLEQPAPMPSAEPTEPTSLPSVDDDYRAAAHILNTGGSIAEKWPSHPRPPGVQAALEDWRAKQPKPDASKIKRGVSIPDDPNWLENIDKDGYRPGLADEIAARAMANAQAAGVQIPQEIDLPALIEEFWSARPMFGHIRTFARARMVSPWAVMGCALARVVANTPPKIQLPPTIGDYASLNLFVGLVGPSGAGKDAARKAASAAIKVHLGFVTYPLGSGEGLSHMFMKWVQKKGEDGHLEQHTEAALVTLGEIDTMDALVKRQSSTVASQLRQAAMGEELGFFYVDTSKRMIVPEHAYRMCLIAGIQPKRSAVLLEDADGGTPQRFLWMPASDPDAPNEEPDEPEPMTWKAPDWSQARRAFSNGLHRQVISLPDIARHTIKQSARDRNRGSGEALDGHSLLTRTKVAAALAILDGRHEVNDEDWHLATTVMAVSDATRDTCAQALKAEGRERNKYQALAEAERTVIVKERVDEAGIRRAVGKIRRMLSSADRPLTRAELRTPLNSDRGHFDDAVQSLITTGEVVAEDVTYRGQSGKRYRLSASA